MGIASQTVQMGFRTCYVVRYVLTTGIFFLLAKQFPVLEVQFISFFFFDELFPSKFTTIKIHPKMLIHRPLMLLSITGTCQYVPIYFGWFWSSTFYSTYLLHYQLVEGDYHDIFCLWDVAGIQTLPCGAPAFISLTSEYRPSWLIRNILPDI